MFDCCVGLVVLVFYWIGVLVVCGCWLCAMVYRVWWFSCYCLPGITLLHLLIICCLVFIDYWWVGLLFGV